MTAHLASTQTAVDEGNPCLTRGSVIGRAVIDSVLIDIEDVATAVDKEFPFARNCRGQLVNARPYQYPVRTHLAATNR